MIYKRFIISNFKGIQKLEFSLDGKTPTSQILTLVGLNETGKTTILEALSFFFDNIKDEKELTITRAIVDDVHELIPKSKKSLFNESIVITAFVSVEENDILEIKKFISSQGLEHISSPIEFSITVKLNFKDSTYINKQRLWPSDLAEVKRKGKGKTTSKLLYTLDRGIWSKLVVHIAANIVPAIIYYPNFLFNFPDQIVLEETENESKEQVFYRNVLQDILTSIDPGLILKEHIVNRHKTGLPKDIDSTEAVVNKMSGQVTRFLTKSKMTAFNKLLENKEILIKYPKNNLFGQIFIEIKLKSGDEEYFIRERSLGFRWFLTYLLFTQFRTFRKGSKKLIFLFDEPASNLHQTGQHRLLDAFEDLTNNSNAVVIYTTHSHHLVNPKWLESTYVVKNNALNYEADGEYNSFMTDVSILRYRTFISNYPLQVNYFQPILDVLEYRPSNLENIPDVIMLEGKNDFYTLEYINKIIGLGSRMNFVPGSGSGSLDSVIQLYYAWGRNYIILLDSDKEGNTQKERYSSKFGKIVDKRVFSLQDISSSWIKTEMENIFTKECALIIQKSVFLDSKVFKKEKFNLAIQELLINSIRIELDETTTNNFRLVMDFLHAEISKHTI